MKFHENMSSGFKFMERTRKLLTPGKPELQFMCSACRLMVFERVCELMKFHENMSSGFKDRFLEFRIYLNFANLFSKCREALFQRK